MLRFDIYEFDDYSQSFFYSDKLWDIIKTADHGRYISWVYMKSVVHGLPLLFNKHPNNIFLIKVVVGMNVATMILGMSLLFSYPQKQKLSPLIYYLSTAMIALSLMPISMSQLMRYNQHFAYLTNFTYFCFFGYIWSLLYPRRTSSQK